MNKIQKSDMILKSSLYNLHLQQYLSTFQQHNIDFEKFLGLNEQTLKSIGIINESHRAVLITCMKYFRKLFTTTEWENVEDCHDEHLFRNYTDHILTITEEFNTDQHVISSHVEDDVVTSAPEGKRSNELPSYFDVAKHKQEANNIMTCEEEDHENLPTYSCSVFKAGYVIKKDEMAAHGVKAKNRTW
ncbi:11296_t:CDS:2, partial [Scutellospora calospora]